MSCWYQSVKRRYYRWIEMGVLNRIFEAVAAEPDLEWVPCASQYPQACSLDERRRLVRVELTGRDTEQPSIPALMRSCLRIMG